MSKYAEMEIMMVSAILKAAAKIKEQGGDIGIIDVVVRCTTAHDYREGVVIRTYETELCETMQGEWFVEDYKETTFQDIWDNTGEEEQ